MTTVHGGDGDIAAERAKLLFVEDFVFGVETKDHTYVLAQFTKLASQHVHRWNTYATADKQRFVACFAEVIAVAKDGKYIELRTNWQVAHSFGAYAYYLIYNGEYAIGDVADRDGAAKELSLYADVYELTWENACGVATKLHSIDILGYLFVGLYFK